MTGDKFLKAETKIIYFDLFKALQQKYIHTFTELFKKEHITLQVNR